MKTRILFIIAIMSLLTTFANSNNTKEKENVLKPYKNTVSFTEKGITFLVSMDGYFDFKRKTRNRYNRHTRKRTKIIRDYYGRIRRVGNVSINYNYTGHVKRIGRVFIKYRRDGYLKKVGNLKINYDYDGTPIFRGRVKDRRYVTKKRYNRRTPRFRTNKRFRNRKRNY